MALGLGALPLYALARRKTGSAPVALFLAAAYLLYPATQWGNAFEFHPEMFSIPALLGVFYYAAEKRWCGYFILLVLTLLTKETAGLTVAAIGLYTLKQDRRAGLLTVGMGLLAVGVAMGVVHHFNHGVRSAYFSLYAHHGETPSEAALHVLGHPADTARSLSSNGSPQYLMDLFKPLGFMPVLAPEILWLAAPALLTNMLSSREIMRTLLLQYTALVIPILMVATVFGFDRLRRHLGGVLPRLALAYLGFCAIYGFTQGPLMAEFGILPPRLDASQREEVEDVLRLIPPEASVCAQVSLVAHLAHRDRVFVFPNPFYPAAYGPGDRALRQQRGEDYPVWPPEQLEASIDRAETDYVALRPASSIFPVTQEVYFLCAMAVLRNPHFGILAVGREVVLLRRGADHATGLRLLAKRVGLPTGTRQEEETALREWLHTQPAPP